MIILDDKNIFNLITHRRFLHDMRMRKASKLVTNFVEDFLKKRYTTLSIKEHTTKMRRVNVNILQDSSHSSILYLFYNAELLNLCDDIKLKISSQNFVDDINILTYSELTKQNCRILIQIYDRCIE